MIFNTYSNKITCFPPYLIGKYSGSFEYELVYSMNLTNKPMIFI